jgi:biotin carboxyl carrier protein
MLKATINDDITYEIKLNSDQILVNDKDFSHTLSHISDRHYNLIFQNQSYNVEVLKADHSRKVFFLKINGHGLEVKLQDRFDQLIEAMGLQEDEEQADKQIFAPMPGLVLELHVNEGDIIKKGTPLLTLEAMKMENVLKSPTDGTVRKIFADTGKSVEKNYLLLEME